MEDIPQPSHGSYSVGDRVRIDIGSNDPDSRYHVEVCEIVDVFTDDLDLETSHTTDAYWYTVRDVETDNELLISFRHYDLVPVEDVQ